MKNYFLILLLCLFIPSMSVANRPHLHFQNFVKCLQSVPAKIDYQDMQVRYRFHSRDNFLLFLSVYYGTIHYWAWPVAGRQFAGYNRWTRPFWAMEEKLAKVLFTRSFSAKSKIDPGQILTLGLNICQQFWKKKDLFCAALISHNVLKTLGRHSRNYARNGRRVFDRNPDWFKKSKAFWLVARRKIWSKLYSLEGNLRSDKWGAIYHFYGLLAYSLRLKAMGETSRLLKLILFIKPFVKRFIPTASYSKLREQIDKESALIIERFLANPKAISGRKQYCRQLRI